MEPMWIIYITTLIYQVERIKLSHDHMEYGTGFHVKEVEIDVPSYGNHYTFPCNCWLAQDELTEMTIKDLNSSTPSPSKTAIIVFLKSLRNSMCCDWSVQVHYSSI